MNGSDTLGEIASVAGRKAAQAMVSAFGGTRVKIPKRATADTVLAQAVGLAAARGIVARFGGADILIPLSGSGVRGQVREAIARGLRQGHSATRVAREVGCHQRTVSRWRKRLQLGE